MCGEPSLLTGLPGCPLCPQFTPLFSPSQGYDVAAPYAREVVDAVGPVVVEAAKKTVELASPALEAAAPAISVRAADQIIPRTLLLQRPRDAAKSGSLQTLRCLPRPTRTNALPHTRAPGTTPSQNTVSDVLESTGVDLSAVSKTAGTVGDVAGSAVSVATPVARGLVDLLATSDPVTLGEFGLGAVALYYLSPLFFGAFR